MLICIFIDDLRKMLTVNKTYITVFNQLKHLILFNLSLALFQVTQATCKCLNWLPGHIVGEVEAEVWK